ncbi:FecR family protein [Aquimarina sp. M1]
MKHCSNFNRIHGLMISFLLLFIGCTDTTTVTTGKKYRSINLPDGSLALLNHNSSIKYNEDFNLRNVKLEGEAFFDVVAHEHPFVVITDHGEVKVLGTEFNVKATTNQLEVDVKEGLVELKTAYNQSKLKKGVKVVYKEGEKTFQQIKSNQEFKKWTKELKAEFKKLGKEIKPAAKNIGKEFKEVGKEIKKEFQKLKNN